MNGAEVLDEYLDELLQTVAGVPAATPLQIVRDIVEAPVTSAAQVAGEAITETSAAPAFAAEPPTPVALAKEPVAADVIAEMLSDPAFGSVDVEGEVEVDAATAADRIAAELIAEMEADPAFPIPRRWTQSPCCWPRWMPIPRSPASRRLRPVP
jgi:purine-binding chemotaxis protein CheW